MTGRDTDRAPGGTGGAARAGPAALAGRGAGAVAIKGPWRTQR